GWTLERQRNVNAARDRGDVGDHRGRSLREPIGAGQRVVVGECDDIAFCDAPPGVSRGGGSVRAANRNVGDSWPILRARAPLRHLLQRRRVIGVISDDDLVAIPIERLRYTRLQAAIEKAWAPIGVTADR